MRVGRCLVSQQKFERDVSLLIRNFNVSYAGDATMKKAVPRFSVIIFIAINLKNLSPGNRLIVNDE